MLLASCLLGIYKEKYSAIGSLVTEGSHHVLLHPGSGHRARTR